MSHDESSLLKTTKVFLFEIKFWSSYPSGLPTTVPSESKLYSLPLEIWGDTSFDRRLYHSHLSLSNCRTVWYYSKSTWHGCISRICNNFLLSAAVLLVVRNLIKLLSSADLHHALAHNTVTSTTVYRRVLSSPFWEWKSDEIKCQTIIHEI